MRLSKTEIECICKENILKLNNKRSAAIKRSKDNIELPEYIQNLISLQKEALSIKNKIKELDKRYTQLLDEMYNTSNTYKIHFSRYGVIENHDFVKEYITRDMPQLPTDTEIKHQITLKNLSKDFNVELFINELIKKYEVFSV